MRAFRQAIRQLAHRPGFGAVTVLTLGLCLGANLAIFAVLDAVVLRDLPYPEPSRLVAVENVYPGAGVLHGGASIANYMERRDAIEAFESVSLMTEYPFTVGEAGSTRNVLTARVTPEFFSTLGVPLAMGQEPTDASLDYNGGEGVIITDRFWRSHFNADPDVLGRTFRMHTFDRVVRGVLPAGFCYLSSKAEIYGHLSHYPAKRRPDNRHANDGQMIARLAPGATMADAQAQLDALNARQLADDPIAGTVEESGFHTRVMGLHEHHVKSVKPIVLLVQAGVLCLLLIGVVNLAGLLLIRASGRSKEIAVRAALGASPGQLSRKILAETLLLTLLGGVVGLALAALGVQLIRVLGMEMLPLGATVTLGARVGLVALVISAGLGVGLAIPILWHHLRDRTSVQLASESRGGTLNRSTQRLRNGFIVAQIALAFVLLCGAGLLAESLERALDRSPGFRPDGVLTAQIVLPFENYPDETSRVRFVRELVTRLRALPGVT